MLGWGVGLKRKLRPAMWRGRNYSAGIIDRFRGHLQGLGNVSVRISARDPDCDMISGGPKVAI